MISGHAAGRTIPCPDPQVNPHRSGLAQPRNTATRPLSATVTPLAPRPWNHSRRFIVSDGLLVDGHLPAARPVRESVVGQPCRPGLERCRERQLCRILVPSQVHQPDDPGRRRSCGTCRATSARSPDGDSASPATGSGVPTRRSSSAIAIEPRQLVERIGRAVGEDVSATLRRSRTSRIEPTRSASCTACTAQLEPLFVEALREQTTIAQEHDRTAAGIGLGDVNRVESRREQWFLVCRRRSVRSPTYTPDRSGADRWLRR